MPTKNKTATRIAYKIIRDKIIYFDSKPGDTLNDKLIAEELQMSRTPVREALILLSYENLVIKRPQSGTYVSTLDIEELKTEQYVRHCIENDIILKACNSKYEGIEEKYQNAVKKYQDAENAKIYSYRDILKADNEFHSISFEITNRRNINAYMQNHTNHIDRLRVLSVIKNEKNFLNEDHDNIGKAIVVGDTVSALYFLKIHMERYIERLNELTVEYPDYFQ